MSRSGAYAERELNRRLPAYVIQIRALDLHPLTLSLDLEDVIVRQKDHPDPRSRPSPSCMAVCSGAPYCTAAW